MATTEKSACLSKSGCRAHRTVGRGKVTSAEAPDREQHERAAFLGSAPPLSRGLIARALAGTVSPRQAIKAFCLVLRQTTTGLRSTTARFGAVRSRLSAPLALGAR